MITLAYILSISLVAAIALLAIFGKDPVRKPAIMAMTNALAVVIRLIVDFGN